MSSFQKVLFTVFDLVIRSVLAISIAKLMAVQLGPSGIFVFNQFQTFLVIASTLAGAGLVNGMTKNVAELSDQVLKRNAFLNSTFIFVTVLGLIVFLIGFALSEELLALGFRGQIQPAVILVAGILFIPYTFTTLIFAILAGFEEPRLMAQLRLYSALALMASFALLYFTLPPNWLLISLLVGPFFGAICGLYILKKHLKFKWGIDFADLKENLGKLKQYYIMGGVSIFALPITLVFVRDLFLDFSGIASLSYWEGVSRICDQFLFFISAFLGLFFLPKIAKATSALSIRFLVKRALLLSCMAGASLALFGYLFQAQTLELFLSKEFASAEPFFNLQLIISIVKTVSMVFGFVLIGRGKFKSYIVTEVSFALTWYVLAYAFRDFGIAGLQQSLLIAYLTYTVVAYLFCRKVFND